MKLPDLILDLLRDLEWSGTSASNGGATCPSCAGLRPEDWSAITTPGVTKGHALTCRLHAAITARAMTPDPAAKIERLCALAVRQEDGDRQNALAVLINSACMMAVVDKLSIDALNNGHQTGGNGGHQHGAH